MSRDVNKLVLWPFPRFCFEACPWIRNGGKVDSAEQEIIASVSDDERQKGREIQVTDVVGRSASAWEVGRRSVKRARWFSQEFSIQGRWGRSRRGRHSTSVLQKVPQLFYFSSYFLHSHIKKLHFSNLFKNVWTTKIDWALFILRPKNQGPGLLK